MDGLDIAISRAGSQHKLARLIGVPQRTISDWTRNKVSAEYLEVIESKTGVSPSLLRPDLKRILAR